MIERLLRSFSRLSALFLLIIFAGIPVETPASELRISNEELVENFIAAAYGDEVLSRNPQRLRLNKWTSPVDVVFMDVIKERQLQLIETHLQRIADITGLQIRYTRSRRRADLYIRVNNVDTILEDLSAMQRNPLNTEDTVEVIGTVSREMRLREELGSTENQCFFLTFNDGDLSGYVGIKRSLGFEAFNACAKEELTQVFGLPGDSDMIGRSIMSEDQADVELTEQDVWFLRILYSPELHNGMTSSQARSAALRFLSNHRPSGSSAN